MTGTVIAITGPEDSSGPSTLPHSGPASGPHERIASGSDSEAIHDKAGNIRDQGFPSEDGYEVHRRSRDTLSRWVSSKKEEDLMRPFPIRKTTTIGPSP